MSKAIPILSTNIYWILQYVRTFCVEKHNGTILRSRPSNKMIMTWNFHLLCDVYMYINMYPEARNISNVDQIKYLFIPKYSGA